MSASLLYQQAPEATRRAKLDNIALVPASLLPFKADYQVLLWNKQTLVVSYCTSQDSAGGIGRILRAVALPKARVAEIPCPDRGIHADCAGVILACASKTASRSPGD